MGKKLTLIMFGFCETKEHQNCYQLELKFAYIDTKGQHYSRFGKNNRKLFKMFVKMMSQITVIWIH